MVRSFWVLCVLMAACGGDDAPRPMTFGTEARPVDLKVPPTLTEGKQYPLVVVLHGRTASGFVQVAVFGVGGLPANDEAFLIAPDGNIDDTGRTYWNADPACCDFERHNPDDVGYLGTMIEDVLASGWPIDDDKVYLLGHSNGAYMAYRMACERSDIIASIGGLAGLAASVPSTCQPARAVNVLHLHGDADAVVPYQSGSGPVMSIGVEPTLTQWIGHNACGTTRAPGLALDLDSAVAGAETKTFSVDGCPPGGAVDLWKMEGSGHLPVFGSSLVGPLMQWFRDHPRS